MGYSLEPSFKILDVVKGTSLEVKFCEDRPDLIEIGPPDEKSKDYYGRHMLIIEEEQANLLAKSILNLITLHNE